MKQLVISIGIIMAAVAAGAVIIFSVQNNEPPFAAKQGRAVETVTPKPEINTGDYQEEVQNIVDTFKANPNQASAQDAHTLLLSLRVPKEAKDNHLALVLYFNAQTEATTVDMVRLQQLADSISWLNL